MRIRDQVRRKRWEMRFKNGQTVTIRNHDHPLIRKTGVVVRLLWRDDSAWVRMNEPLPDNLARFPKGDSRRDHILLFPEDCEQTHGTAEDKGEQCIYCGKDSWTCEHFNPEDNKPSETYAEESE